MARTMTNHGGMEGCHPALREKEIFLMCDPAYSKVQMELAVQSVSSEKARV